MHVGFRSRPIHHRHEPFPMEKPVPLEAEYPSHHPTMRKFVVPDEEFLRPWSHASSSPSTTTPGLQEDDYYYKDETPVDSGPG